MDAEAKGRFHGVLPDGFSDNFTGWVPVSVTSELRRDASDGEPYVSFKVGPGGRAQFSGGLMKADRPRIYKITVVMRSRSERSPGIGLRQHGRPYREIWDQTVKTGGKWRTLTFFGTDKSPKGEDFGVYLYLPTGEHDFKRVAVDAVEEAELQATIRRPPRSVRHFARHTRFPLGLPNGWSVGCEAHGAKTGRDTEQAGPDGLPTLVFEAERGAMLCSEPMQTSDPTVAVRLNLRYRATGAWKVSVLNGDGDRWHACLWQGPLEPASAWREKSVLFLPAKFGETFFVKFEGTGRLWLDAFDAGLVHSEPRPSAPVCALVLTPGAGEAAIARIHFMDEKARVGGRVFGAPKGSAFHAQVRNVYGETIRLPTVPVPPSGELTVDYDVFPDRKHGAMLVSGRVYGPDGKPLTPVEELQMTRVERPVRWNRPAPESPFGAHLVADESTLVACKAAGVNWTRFHDSGWQYSCWAALEARRGEWTWHDEEIALFRKWRFRMFAQLGTAPGWATHFGEIGHGDGPDYFERYFRPTNAVDWVNYVQTFVRRYRGTIDDYFVWNEPWGKYWRRAADLGFYDKAKAARDFGAFQKLTWEAVKAVHPQARVSGFNTSVGGADWTAGCLEGDPEPGCEIVDFHTYLSDPRLAAVDEEKVSGPCLDPIRARPGGLKGKEIWMSEGQGNSAGNIGGNGRMTGLYRAILPFAAEPPEQMHAHGDQQCRYVISLLTEGVSKVFLYTTHSFTGLGNPPNYQVLIGPDGFPHPSLAAHAHMARMIEGLTFASRTKHGENGVRVDFAGAGRAVTAYANLSPAEAAALAARENVCDLYGNPFDARVWVAGTLLWTERINDADKERNAK